MKYLVRKETEAVELLGQYFVLRDKTDEFLEFETEDLEKVHRVLAGIGAKTLPFSDYVEKLKDKVRLLKDNF